ncbi:MAG: MGH1-like glycoside hydrolase domain-containing protein [Acidimicrobiales bacterium]|jgi:hypothetical protein
MGTERDRVAGFGHLEDGLRTASDWYWWGPYLSERQWGTVREDYSADGDAWSYLTHDQARSRAYRWGDDGLAGFSDIEQRLCLGLALWNGRDPILKERLFGLNQSEANHGEDVKEYWWYLDGLPSHAWNRWRYHYPQGAFPYGDLVAENSRRSRTEPEYELLDTGVFDEDRYWVVEAHYAKADPTDLLLEIEVTNAGPEADTLHVLPTAWFRNTWSWEVDGDKPQLGLDELGLRIDHPWLGTLELVAGPSPDGTSPEPLFCENETNAARLFGVDPLTPFPKDGINDHVVHGAPTVNPERVGTKAAYWYRLHVGPGETVTVKLRLRPRSEDRPPTDELLGTGFDTVVARRRAEADEFYAGLTGPTCTDDEALVMRQAFAGLLWSKQLYHYDVARWLEGDPTQPPPPEGRSNARNARWRHFESFDIMSMPDKWEYPWFAAWDLAFHCIPLAHIDPAFAKYQLILVCREWFQHPNGALPAYEWDFGDVNPPVQAWAALEVFAIDGGTDLEFLSRILDKLMVNFTWWVNREDADGSNLFEGGFLGLDNIGPIDRSHLPVGGLLQQADATGWMAYYALTLGTIASILNRAGQRPVTDLVVKFLEHFALVSEAMDRLGLYDETEGLYFDRLRLPDGTEVPIKVRSMVGIIPMLASGIVDGALLDRAQLLGKGFASHRQQLDLDQLAATGVLRGEPGDQRLMLGVVSMDHVLRLVSRLLDESEFLSPHGLRALSAYHRQHPCVLDVEGVHASIDYEPAESTTAMFGGNSNWRGPVWFPLNYLVCNAIERYGRFLGDEVRLDYPTGSGNQLSLDEIATELRKRTVALFLVDGDGRRPCFGRYEKLQTDPRWKNNLLFNEYFNGDTGEGLGATHQTGWTALVADQIRRAHDPDVLSLFDVAHRVAGQ